MTSRHVHKRCIWRLVLLGALFGCTPEENKLAVDNDGDGFTEFEGDCDDGDPATFPGAAHKESVRHCMTDYGQPRWSRSGIGG